MMGTTPTAMNAGRKQAISGTTDSIEKISRMIANGKGDMPGFKKKLTAAQIKSIANYVKTL